MNPSYPLTFTSISCPPGVVGVWRTVEQARLARTGFVVAGCRGLGTTGASEIARAAAQEPCLAPLAEEGMLGWLEERYGISQPPRSRLEIHSQGTSGHALQLTLPGGT